MIEYLVSFLPAVPQEYVNSFFFVTLLTNILLLIHWNWSSFLIGLISIFHLLHYANTMLVQEYEYFFIGLWVILLYYHLSMWINNFHKVTEKLEDKQVIASNEWKLPLLGNGIHVISIFIYGFLLYLHIIPFITPIQCLGASSPLCCRYNYAIEGFEAQSVNTDFCSGRVRIAFVGSWSTGKTSIINALLGHEYSTSQISPVPTTDKFTCLVPGAKYSAPIRSDDYGLRRHCEIMSHINDVTHSKCQKQLPNVIEVADENTEFGNFVFFDTPGWQNEYMNNCEYDSFYKQLTDKVDFIYVVWDVSHGIIEDYFGNLFKNQTKGTDYELIYNRYDSRNAIMSFFNQQYAKMTNGKEILSEMHTIKLRENTTKYAKQYENDVQFLRDKILSVNQTVYDNRKKTMKKKLLSYRSKMTGLLSLHKLKMANSLIEEDLNIHIPPKGKWLRNLGLEL